MIKTHRPRPCAFIGEVLSELIAVTKLRQFIKFLDMGRYPLADAFYVDINRRNDGNRISIFGQVNPAAVDQGAPGTDIRFGARWH